MSDIYYKDTLSALKDSVELTEELDGFLATGELDVIKKLNDETEHLLEQYKHALEKIEELQYEICEIAEKGE